MRTWPRSRCAEAALTILLWARQLRTALLWRLARDRGAGRRRGEVPAWLALPDPRGAVTVYDVHRTDTTVRQWGEAPGGPGR